MKKLLVAVSFAALAAASPAHAASLVGNSISCAQVGAGSSFTCSPVTATVGAGQEFVAGNLPASSAIGFDFSANSLLISNLINGTYSLGATVISFTNLTNPFTSASLVSSSIAGFNGADVSIVNGALRLNFADTTWTSRDTATITLQAAQAVPEPATWALMLLGFAAVGGMMRSSRSKPRVTVRYA